MQQKVFLIVEIFFFCIYFSLNNFNYPKKVGNPIKINKILPQHSRKTFTKLSSVLGADISTFRHPSQGTVLLKINHYKTLKLKLKKRESEILYQFLILILRDYFKYSKKLNSNPMEEENNENNKNCSHRCMEV